jgi:hypothetical protein
MELRDNWPQIKATFDSAIATSLHCAIASVSAAGQPHVTPIGFIFLRDDFSAFYFEEYPNTLRENLAHNRRVCLSLVNSSRMFWFRSLLRGRFVSPPGVRLMGVAGERRRATDQERALYLARVRPLRRLRGYDLIWRDLSHVRDIQLESFAPVVYPKMTEGLWV